MGAKAVLFDFDGVIIDTEWPIYESWKRVYEGEGHELGIETYVQCIGSDFDTWSPEKYLEELTGKEFDWPAINAKRQVELEGDLVGVEVLAGVREMFEALGVGGDGSFGAGVSDVSESDRLIFREMKLAVVSSSTHRWVDAWLEKLGLVELVDEVICRGDAACIKPAPDLYEEAVKRFSLAAGECLVIEDSLNGVKAGNAAGCVTVAVPSRLTGCLDFSEADLVIGSLVEFRI